MRACTDANMHAYYHISAQHIRSGKYMYQGDGGIDKHVIQDNVFACAHKHALTVL